VTIMRFGVMNLMLGSTKKVTLICSSRDIAQKEKEKS
jgi:hypothetical protein